ncbi:MAG TPA: neutral/alkaline non-lysosomal ceramidase N-terminal domain-containing protein, partial [Longimicrobium sp.]|nr:neutral/alkaline non-lysosomal ceramidase N-terminal domain-containing protein [Longimicrobium sp.]
MRALRFLSVLGALAAGACGRAPIPLPTPQSPAPVASDTGGLRAGFARVDITPPPGPAMIGYGTEGKPAVGYRGRLHARAMVLEDRGGERFAIVVLDLGMPSVYLHRLVADRTMAVSIGADRLLLAGTHTHAGPGNFFAVPGPDTHGSTRSGFDDRLAAFLVDRIASAVQLAADSLRPARAAWAVDSVWGRTRLRSDTAFRSNRPIWRSSFPPPDGLTDAQRGVDPAWRMLRVDTWDAAAGRLVPRGAFSVFAIHGTAIPGANELFDPDVHGIVSRALEAHIDAAAGRADVLHRRGVHLFANGAEGDVSPDVPLDTRCETPRIGRERRLAGPRGAPQPDRWLPVPDSSFDRCMRRAKFWADSLGRSLAARVARQYDALGARMDSLERAGGLETLRGMRIARAFATVPLRRSEEDRSLCPQPLVGTGLAAGAEDGYTRLRGWKLLGFVGPGFAMNHDTAWRGVGCHAEKRVALGRLGILQGLVSGPHGLPEVAELTAVRIGGVVLGTLPAEPTTTVGGRIRNAMAAHAGVLPDSVALMAVTNGYVQYLTTPEEYRWQFYEGGATEYGPYSAPFFEDALARLAATLRPSPVGAPPGRVSPLTAYHSGGLKSFPAPRGPEAAA